MHCFLPKALDEEIQGPQGREKPIHFHIANFCCLEEMNGCQGELGITWGCKCYFRILWRVFFFPPPPPPAFSLLRLLIEASLQAKAKGMHFMAGILGGLARTRFLAGWPQAGCLLARRRGGRHTEKKRAIHILQRHCFLPPDGGGHSGSWWLGMWGWGQWWGVKDRKCSEWRGERSWVETRKKWRPAPSLT